MEETNMEIPKIDLIFLARIWFRYARRFWAMGLAAMVLCSLLLGIISYRTYTPVYEARLSFTVRTVDSGSDAAARQLHDTIPNILRSEILQKRVRDHLGAESIPSVSTTVLANSNVFTISVRHTDPAWAYRILEAVLVCYPQIADHVVGPTELVILDDSGVPDHPLAELDLRRTTVLGGAAGFAIWAFYMLLLTLSRRAVHNEDELKQTLEHPCLGILPVAKGKSGLRDSVRMLQMRVQKEMEHRAYRILLISGAMPGEGTTTIAANLAKAFGRKGHRVLLVDCDGSAGTQERKTALLDLLTADVKDAENKELLQKQLDAYRQTYDYVILDAPSCALTVDAAELSDLADCALMVIRQDYSSRARIIEGETLLTEGGVPLLGCVLNAVSGNLAGTG